ncbi:MAG TPA: ribonuclease PH [Phycisphaerae bacterium]|nr:ribonuclease PH [Phycisphaerae bacterium]
MLRSDGRRANQLRPIEIQRGYTELAHGSVLMAMGKTRVLCTASVEPGVPEWRESQNSGWLTAEYDMLPASTGRRRMRSRNRVDGRSQEIQRLIGRALRAVVDMDKLAPYTVWIDCDVVQADGGTRTAAITGAFVALHDAVDRALAGKLIAEQPILDSIAAVSVGRVNGTLLLDLDYQEDAAAEVDLNAAMTGTGRFVEIQGTGESATFTRAELDRMLRLVERGCRQLHRCQQQALDRTRPGATRLAKRSPTRR